MVWLCAITCGTRGQPLRACNLCHMTIIRKWLPNMGMLSSASTFCLFERILRSVVAPGGFLKFLETGQTTNVLPQSVELCVHIDY